MKRPYSGDGDPCPAGCPGAMWLLPSRHQYCPDARHPGGYLYDYDGLTPLGEAPRSADDARTSSRARPSIPASLPASPA